MGWAGLGWAGQQGAPSSSPVHASGTRQQLIIATQTTIGHVAADVLFPIHGTLRMKLCALCHLAVLSASMWSFMGEACVPELRVATSSS
jgi:hypothetical protein